MTSVSSASSSSSTVIEDALGRLVQSNLRIVVHYAKRFRRLGVPLLDLIHEGNLGLDRSGTAFRSDPRRGLSARSDVVDSPGDDASAGRNRPQRGNHHRGICWPPSRRAGRSRPFAWRLNTRSRRPPGRKSRSRATSDAEDFAAHIREKGRRRNLRKARRKRHINTGTLHALRQHSVLRGYLN